MRPTASAEKAPELSERILQRTTAPLVLSVLRVPGKQMPAMSGLIAEVIFAASPEYTKGNEVPSRWKLLSEVPFIFPDMKRKKNDLFQIRLIN